MVLSFVSSVLFHSGTLYRLKGCPLTPVEITSYEGCNTLVVKRWCLVVPGGARWQQQTRHPQRCSPALADDTRQRFKQASIVRLSEHPRANSTYQQKVSDACLVCFHRAHRHRQTRALAPSDLAVTLPLQGAILCKVLCSTAFFSAPVRTFACPYRTHNSHILSILSPARAITPGPRHLRRSWASRNLPRLPFPLRATTGMLSAASAISSSQHMQYGTAPSHEVRRRAGGLREAVVLVRVHHRSQLLHRLRLVRTAELPQRPPRLAPYG